MFQPRGLSMGLSHARRAVIHQVIKTGCTPGALILVIIKNCHGVLAVGASPGEPNLEAKSGVSGMVSGRARPAAAGQTRTRDSSAQQHLARWP